MSKAKFTVFTPTYNRCNKLPNVYQCLLKQSYKNFEWIIVDDGSTDETKELVNGWINENKIDIHYYQLINGGKHRALNKGIDVAIGEWFICLDSDDTYTQDALEKLSGYSETIFDDESIAGMPCLSSDLDGNLIGTKFPEGGFICSHFDLYYSAKVTGDKGFIYKTNILRQYKFPEIAGEKFLTEAVVLNRIAQDYNVFCINEVMQSVDYQSDGLSSKAAQLSRMNPKGYVLFLNERNNFNLVFIDRLLNNSRYIKFCLLSNYTISYMYKNCIKRDLWFGIYYLLGIVLFLKSKIVSRNL